MISEENKISFLKNKYTYICDNIFIRPAFFKIVKNNSFRLTNIFSTDFYNYITNSRKNSEQLLFLYIYNDENMMGCFNACDWEHKNQIISRLIKDNSITIEQADLIIEYSEWIISEDAGRLIKEYLPFI